MQRLLKVFLALILVTILDVANAEDDHKKKLPNTTVRQIVGGTLAVVGEFPSFAATAYASDNFQYCGSSVVWKDILLGAAHCEIIAPFALAIQANIGGTLADASNAETIAIESELPHPDFNATTFQNDVMLLKLVSPTSAPLTRINSEFSNPEDNDPVTTVGFGATEFNGNNVDSLVKVTIPTVNFEECKLSYDFASVVINNGFELEFSANICAGAANMDACTGDSGGPLLDKDGVSVGITSWGEDCGADGFPGIWTRVSTYSDWILDNICTLSDDPPECCGSNSCQVYNLENSNSCQNCDGGELVKLDLWLVCFDGCFSGFLQFLVKLFGTCGTC